jgi:hypothetical protein
MAVYYEPNQASRVALKVIDGCTAYRINIADLTVALARLDEV